MVAETHNEIIIILSKLIALLEETEDYDWACFFKNKKKNLMSTNNKEQIAREIIDSYRGGMGSFVDLVLQKNMKMLINENNLLNEYRESLFESCEKIVGVDYLKNL